MNFNNLKRKNLSNVSIFSKKIYASNFLLKLTIALCFLLSLQLSVKGIEVNKNKTAEEFLISESLIKTDSLTWTFAKDSMGLKFFYSLGTFNDKPYLFLLIKNTNSTEVKINWSLYLEGPETPVSIGANKEIFGSSSDTSPIYLKYFMSPGLEIGGQGIPIEIKSIEFSN